MNNNDNDQLPNGWVIAALGVLLFISWVVAFQPTSVIGGG